MRAQEIVEIVTIALEEVPGCNILVPSICPKTTEALHYYESMRFIEINQELD
jgi:hypothetical protein